MPKSATTACPLVEQDVLGLDVAVDDAARMRVLQRVRDFAAIRSASSHRQLPLALQPLAQRLALDERHHVVEDAVGLAGVVQRHDVRVLEARPSS